MKVVTPACEHCKSRNKSLFHYCHLDELEDISAAKSSLEYKRGQILFQEGSHPYGVYCVNQGKIKVYKYASDGKEQIIRIATPGDIVGYSSLLSSTKYPVSAAALEDSIVCHVPKENITKIFKSNERFSEELITMLGRTIQESFGKIADMAYKPVRGRMAEALLLLSTTYRDDNNPEGEITITREDLASLVGTVKETAIRTLKEFKTDKLIETDQSKIRVLQPQGLARISELYD